MKSKAEKVAHYNGQATLRAAWRKRNAYYYADTEGYISSLVPAGKRVIELGCGTGQLIRKTRPSYGLGVDFSESMIAIAIEENSSENILYQVGDIECLTINEEFDYVILSDVLGELEDVWSVFASLEKITHPRSRVIITYFNEIWRPLLELGEKIGLKMPQDNQNWLDISDIENLLSLNKFEALKTGYRFWFPLYVPFLSPFLNKVIGKLPIFNKLGLVSYVVAKPRISLCHTREPSVTVLIPCRNEKGNIRDAVERIPEMGCEVEILFVDGSSTDGTVEEIESIIQEFIDTKNIKLIHQAPGLPQESTDGGKMLKLGKGDAVRKGFSAASGDILMILDADLTVVPEDLPKFYQALVDGHGDFINGTRLVYPMEENAMRALNKYANRFFGWLFSWLLDQPIKDTLCGTKVLYKEDYAWIADNRDYFGEIDPFGDFDLLFGADRLNLKITEMPIRYAERKYGDIKIERFKHGILLLKMSWVALRKLKFR